MSVESDPQSDQPADEVLVGPEQHSRRWIAVVSAGAAVALVGGAVILAANGSSASPGSIAAAASSASTTSGGSPAAKPTGTDGRRPLPVAPVTPFLYGTVKSVTGTKIVITDLQGFARTIVTSSKTTYKDGLTSSPAVGAKILAAGTIAADGTSLDATAVSSPKLPEGFGGPRPGGTGGSGAAGGKGSGGPAHPGPRGPVTLPTKTS